MGHLHTAKVEDPLILTTQLEDGSDDKYVRAFVQTDDGINLLGSPFTLPHKFLGKYSYKNASTLKFPSGILEIHVQYVIYDDAGFTQQNSSYGIDLDIWQKDTSGSLEVDDILDKVCQILNTISSINPGAELVACIESIEICGVIEIDEITGVVEVYELSGFIESEDEIYAWVASDNELIGVLEEQDA